MQEGNHPIHCLWGGVEQPAAGMSGRIFKLVSQSGYIYNGISWVHAEAPENLKQGSLGLGARWGTGLFINERTCHKKSKKKPNKT